MSTATQKIREELLRLLKEDEEFRYAVAGLLGFEEILKRIDKNTEAILKLQEQVAMYSRVIEEHTRAIRSLQEQVAEHSRIIEEHSKAIEKLASSIQAIGMRYGVFSEEAFRAGLRHLVEDLLQVYRVDKWIYYDKNGIVYGHPSIVEVDMLVRDKEYILVEYKSMADRSDVAELYRIGKLFGEEEKIKPKLLMVVASIRKRAKELADTLGIEVRGQILDL